LDQRMPRPSLGEALRMTILVLEALEQLHARGLVHGDLRPEVLLYDPEGRSLHIVDCGWACERGSALRPFADRSGPHLAPERTGAAAGPLDGRSDLYSVGVLLHQLVAGELPSNSGLRQ